MKITALIVLAGLVLASCGLTGSDDDFGTVNSLDQYHRIEKQVDSAANIAADEAAAAVRGTVTSRRGGVGTPACNELDKNRRGFTRERGIKTSVDVSTPEAMSKISRAWNDADWPDGLRTTRKSPGSIRLTAPNGPDFIIYIEAADEETRTPVVNLLTSCLSATDEVNEQIDLEELRERTE